MLEVRGARPEEVDAAIECCAISFGQGDNELIQRKREFFSRIHKLDPNFAPENTRVAVLDGQVVSVAQVFDRQMLIGGTPVRLGGVGSVATHPAHRGKGYGTLVLRDTATYMRSIGSDLSLLSAGIPAFYERFGWRPFNQRYETIVQIPDEAPEAPFEGHIRLVDWENDRDVIMEIHRDHDWDATGPLFRTTRYWHRHVVWRPFGPNQFWVATLDGRIVTYLIASDEHGLIDEFGVTEGHERALIALLFHTLRMARQSGRREVRSITLRAYQTYLNEYGLSTDEVPIQRFMFRIIDLESLLRKLLPQMQRRLKSSEMVQWEGSIVIESEVGNVVFVLRRGHVSLDGERQRSAQVVRLFLSHSELIELLLGPRSASKALADDLQAGPGVSEWQAQQLLEILFPRRFYTWYPRDKF